MQLVRDRAKTSTLQQQLVWTPVSVQGAGQAREESPAAGVCTPRLSVYLSVWGVQMGLRQGRGADPSSRIRACWVSPSVFGGQALLSRVGSTLLWPVGSCTTGRWVGEAPPGLPAFGT